jgi:prolyl oligopeptidase
MKTRRFSSSLAALPLVLAAACGCPGEDEPPATPVAPRPMPVASASASAAPIAVAPSVALPAYGYPATRKDNVVETIHGQQVADPYRWLEDAKTEEVKAWMKAEDEFARAKLAPLPGRDAIAQRMKELSYIEAMGTPHHYGSRYFYGRRAATAEKWTIYWKEGKKGEEKVLLDPASWSPDGSVSLGGWVVSWDGKKVAYTVKSHNSDEATLYVMDVSTGKKSEVDVIEGAKYGHAEWTPKGDAFYYVWLPVDTTIPVAERPGYAEVRYHKLGEDPKKDITVREKTGDAKTFLEPTLSKDGRWLFVSIQRGWSSNDLYFQDLKATGARGWTKLADASSGISEATAYKDKFYIRTNAGAPTWRVMRTDAEHLDPTKWTEIVPARADATLHEMSIVGGKLSLGYLKDVISRLEVRDLDGKLVREVTLPGIGSAGAFSGQPDEDEAYYSFDSFTQPYVIFETSVASGATSKWYELKIPVDTSKYVVDQEKFTSKDGTSVPMFIVHAKDAKKDGSAPAMLTGYGGFQVARLPHFDASIYPWLEHGGVFALANLRGGNEYGEEWHKHGMRHEKQHVFDDFIGAAEHLIKDGYTASDKLVIRGGSNGGLLVGAAVAQRPDLFRVALCHVPLLDMVRYHKFGSGKTWVDEYGSAEDEEDFKALYAYSPYHHITYGTKYPSVLVLSADSDDRVDPMHARKYAAELQNSSTGGIVLLRIEKNSGHGGADLVKANVEKVADEYAFAFSEIAKKP